jgi:hypothetical protein
MQSLYYTYASGSQVSSLIIISDTSLPNFQQTYSDVTLEITASAYDSSGSIYTSTVADLRVYVKSGSLIYASYPLDSTNIYYSYYTAISASNPPSASFDLRYTFNPNTTPTSSLNTFILYNNTKSSLVFSSSAIPNNGSDSLIVGDNYTITLSGSGDFYTSSITITDTTYNVTSYYTASNAYLTASFSSSNTNNYSVVAQIQTFPILKLTFKTTGDIPVSPTSSLAAWNTYLNTSASIIANSGSVVYLYGGNLSSINSIAISGSKLTNYSSSGMLGLTSQSLQNTELLSFPNIDANPSLTYFNCTSHSITSSIPNLTNNRYLQYFNCATGSISGSISNLSSSVNLTYFDCSNNKLTGSINLFKSYNIQHFDCSYNQLSGSMTTDYLLLTNGNLQYFNCKNNALTGQIPGTYNTLISYFNVSNNKFTTYEGTLIDNPVSDYMTYFDAQNNLLSQSAVDQILLELSYTATVSGTVNLAGTGNSTPSGAGLAVTASLKSRGWTVYVN